MFLLDPANIKIAALASLIVFVAYWFGSKFARDQKIRQLGARGPLVKSYVPFGLKFPYASVKAARQHKTLEMWQGQFETLGCVDNKSYTFEFEVLLTRIVFTADPENIKAVLTSQFADYGKGEKFHDEWKDFLGDSIFATDGQQWSDSRQLIRPMFMRERVADLDIIEEHVRKLLNLIGPGDGQKIQLDRLLSRFTLDASTHFLFGHSAGSLDDPQAKFGLAFDEVQRMQSTFGRAGPLRHFMSRKSFEEGLKMMDEFIDPWITEALSLNITELDAKAKKDDTFLHALARFTRDRKVIRDQLVSLLLAGRDTTQATLSWLFLELARNPKVLQKLHMEIHNTVGATGERPSYGDIKDMKYLTAVINETMRLYPAVPFNIRTALRDTTLPRGGGSDGLSPVAAPKGTPIGYSTLMMQRRRDLYPPISDSFPYDPLEWVPERWATWTPKSWQFIPFNGGPRICIGQQFAMVEMGYTIIRILQHFDGIVDYGNTTTMRTDILLTPADGVHLGFVNHQTYEGKK